MQDPKKSHIKELINNRKATFQYEILEKLETGIVLTGTEIKSLREGGGSLVEAYVLVEKTELWLIGCSITPYSFGSHYNHEEKRKRKLLAHHIEIQRLDASMKEKGYTCIPLSIYLKNGKAKVLIGLAKGKKIFDKREAIKDRDDKRSIQRALKNEL